MSDGVRNGGSRTAAWPPLVVAMTAVLTAGCEPAELPTPTGNNVCEAPTVQAALPAPLEETSGVAASRTHTGVFWTHNDSGGEPAVFAFDSTGTVLAAVRVRDATNRDWEDIAIGPCGATAGSGGRVEPDPGQDDCIFIAEIGDNSEHHPNVAAYRFPEPDPATDTESAPAEILRFTYPDGARDAEALFVTDAGLHVINKGRSDAIELYRLDPPYRADSTVPLTRVQRLAPPPPSVSAQVTAAAASPDGRRAVVRRYAGLLFYEIRSDSLVPLGRDADVAAPAQLQGEGVDFAGGDRFVLTGEAQGPRPPSLALISCDPLRTPADSATTGS